MPTLCTKFEGVYRNEVDAWAEETCSVAMDAWEGPGTYVADAGYVDGVPYATFRRVK